MGRRLRMTAELGDWLTELGESEPNTAAVVAGSRKRLSVRLDERCSAGADAAEIAELERELVAARQGEEVLTEQSQRRQSQIDAFRTAKETATAMYTAAEAQLRIAEAIEAAGGEPEADLARLRDECRTAEERLRALHAATGTQVIIHQGSDLSETADPAAAGRPKPPPDPQPAAQPARGLLELRADPLGTDIRILLAVEPANTVTLLAVLEGPEAAGEHGAEAIRLASELLTEIRDRGWPADAGEVTFEDCGAFLVRTFPADAGGISRRAGILAAPVNEL